MGPDDTARAGRTGDPSQTPPDVFLSYAREDRKRAKWAVRVLKSRGWSVWFDEGLVGGELWQKAIDQTLDHVGCVVVLWSTASVESHWVLDEAGEGLERGVLVPALVDDVEIPFGFRQVQAIDLVPGRVPPERAEEALVAAVAAVLGRPAIEPPKPSRLARVLRTRAPLVAAVLPAAVGVPILLQPVAETGIDLSVRASQVSFVSARQQDLTDLIVVAAFEADGLETVRVPRTRAGPEQTLQAADGRGLRLRLEGNRIASASGSVTISDLPLAAGSRVTLAALDSQSLRISMSGSQLPITLSVEGELLMTRPAGDTELVDFRTPRQLTVEPDATGADLVMRGVNAAHGPGSLPLDVEAVSLARIDETLETTQTALTVVSTIVSGTVRFHPPDGDERTIGAGERLRFGQAAGSIDALELADGALHLRFQGRVRDMESCSGEVCESWMPSILGSLLARRLAWVLGLGAIYLLGLAAIAKRRAGAYERALIWALAFGVSGATGADARQNMWPDDPEESIRRLVVRVDSDVGFGSGIIVGARSDTLFIATANHVVRRGPGAAGGVQVRFRWRPDPSVPATILPNADDSLDLAVLAISPLSDLPPDSLLVGVSGSALFDVRMLPFDRLGDLSILDRGDPIYLLGQPNGLPWRINTVPERFIEFRGESLDFESNLLARGHSGGALLNEDREVIGMLKSDQAPYGEAVSMYAVARRLEAWGYPVDLRLRAPQLSAGSGRTCVLTSRGETRCQGFDDRYESRPLEVGMRLKRLSIRDDHACGLAAGGRAFCVGNNYNGQLGDGTTTSRYGAPAEVSGGLTFESVDAGSGHTCGIVTGGDVYCWGVADGGQLGAFYPESMSVPVRVPTTESFRSLSLSWGYSCGLTRDGAAYCWGRVANRGYATGTTVARFAPDLRFVALAAGHYHTCGITGTGAAWCWGFNDVGQLGSGTTDSSEGRPGVGPFIEEPRAVVGGHSFIDLSSGVLHTCGVTTDGAAWCWGLNNLGQLGNGTTENSAVPVRVAGDLEFEAIAAGDRHTCGLTTDGTVWCWGDNEEGGVGPSGQPVHTEPFRAMRIPEEDRIPWRR